MAEEFKSHEVKEEIRAGLARIQGMLPGTTGDFLQSKRKEYFANFVTQDDLAAFFNEGYVTTTGLDEQILQYKIAEAGMALLLDRAFADEASVLPVIAANVRAELSNVLQHELGIKITLDFLNSNTLRCKILKQVENRGTSCVASWNRVQADQNSKVNGKAIKVTMRGTKNVQSVAGVMTKGRDGEGGAKKEADESIILTKLNQMCLDVSFCKRKLDQVVGPQQLHTAVRESEGRVQAYVDKRFKSEAESTGKRMSKIEAVLRGAGLMPQLVDLTTDDEDIKKEELLEQDDEQEEEDELEDEEAEAAAAGF